MDSKKWTYWEVGYYSSRGDWVKITTVFAPDEDAARCKARKALNRPGRHNEYQRWKINGCEVLEQ